MTVDKLDISGSTTRATTASPSVVSHVSYSSTGIFQVIDYYLLSVTII